MRKLTTGILAALLVFAPMAMADDAKPVDKPAVTEVAKPADAADAKVEPVTEEGAPTPDTGAVDENPGEYMVEMVDAFHNKNWTLAIGMLLMLLVWFVRKFIWKSIPEKLIPWISAGLAIVATFSVDLIGGDVIWWRAILSALASSAGAVFLWESLFKHIAGKKEA